MMDWTFFTDEERSRWAPSSPIQSRARWLWVGRWVGGWMSEKEEKQVDKKRNRWVGGRKTYSYIG